MKTALRLIPLGLAAALALTGCASSSSPAASTAATGGSSAAATGATADVTLVDPGKLTVCTNPPYEPFEFSDASGNIVGLDIDIVGEVAKDLGVGDGLLRNWQKKFEAEGVLSPAAAGSVEEELKRLREENRRLKMEREILKKAAAFFANESN